MPNFEVSETLKTIIVFCACVWLSAICLSIAYSVSTRGYAEFKFSATRTEKTASSTVVMGFNFKGWQVNVVSDVEKKEEVK